MRFRTFVYVGVAIALIAAICEVKIERPPTTGSAVLIPGAQSKQNRQDDSEQPQQVVVVAPPGVAPAPHVVEVMPAMAGMSGPRRSADEHRGGPRLNGTELAAVDLAGGERSTEAAKSKTDVAEVADQIAEEIREALGLRKTLVVLLLEQTTDAGLLPERVANQFSRVLKDLDESYPGKLEAAIIGYGSDVKLITADAGEASKVAQTLSQVHEARSDKANMFAAFQQAVDKFLPYRKRGYEVIFVVAGASPGDDLNLADKSIIALKRAAVPVLGIGPAMPFGAPRKTDRPGRNASTSPDADNRQFESLGPERIQLALSGNQNTADLTDSGYGPFGLERICRMTGGKFYRLRNGKPAGWTVDPGSADVKAELSAKYAPDYVDETQYQQLLNENKCRLALHNAALLPPTEGLETVKTSFAKEKDEAALARTITTAQRAAAERDQPIQKLYDTLVAGEADRPKLTGARWQAGYDLAMGQILAAKARLDGYNTILAIIKQGKTFANEGSSRWVLEPAEDIAAGSALDKMAKKSRVYLQRVVAEHPGTPWAAVAERELRYPAGWKLSEK